MSIHDTLCIEFPFASINDESLRFTLDYSTSSYSDNFEHLEYNNFAKDFDKYNGDLDIDEFYLRYRSVNAAKSVYKFLHDISLPIHNTLTICNMNIRSI